jgi:hypothetical protein
MVHTATDRAGSAIRVTVIEHHLRGSWHRDDRAHGEAAMETPGLFRQCGCRDAATGRRLRLHCPRLAAQRRHGTWYYRCYIRDLLGKAVQISRGGYSTLTAARLARTAVLAESQEHYAGRTWTVERWLTYWLTTRTSIRPTTHAMYTCHVRTFLNPAIGHLRLAEVTSRHLTAMFADLAAGMTAAGHPRSPSTVQRIRATLRAAYNAAIREGMVTDNPARRVEIPPADALTRSCGPTGV